MMRVMSQWNRWTKIECTRPPITRRLVIGGRVHSMSTFYLQLNSVLLYVKLAHCIYLLMYIVGKSEIAEDSLTWPTVTSDNRHVGQPRPLLHRLAWTEIQLAATGRNH